MVETTKVFGFQNFKEDYDKWPLIVKAWKKLPQFK